MAKALMASANVIFSKKSHSVYEEFDASAKVTLKFREDPLSNLNDKDRRTFTHQNPSRDSVRFATRFQVAENLLEARGSEFVQYRYAFRGTLMINGKELKEIHGSPKTIFSESAPPRLVYDGRVLTDDYYSLHLIHNMLLIRKDSQLREKNGRKIWHFIILDLAALEKCDISQDPFTTYTHFAEEHIFEEVKSGSIWFRSTDKTTLFRNSRRIVKVPNGSSILFFNVFKDCCLLLLEVKEEFATCRAFTVYHRKSGSCILWKKLNDSESWFTSRSIPLSLRLDLVYFYGRSYLYFWLMDGRTTSSINLDEHFNLVKFVPSINADSCLTRVHGLVGDGQLIFSLNFGTLLY